MHARKNKNKFSNRIKSKELQKYRPKREKMMPDTKCIKTYTFIYQHMHNHKKYTIKMNP